MAVSASELDSLRPALLAGLRHIPGPWNQDPESGKTPPETPPSPALEKLADGLLAYTAELYRFNEKLGLVEAEPAEFVHAHLLDSLAPIAALPQEIGERFRGRNSLIDVGSGAGLPGIPLALAFPELSVTLLDRAGRRCGFLRNVLAILGRREVSIYQGELTEGRRRLGGSFDLLTARAFRPLNRKLYGELTALLSEGGEMVLYKGRRGQTEAELASLLEGLELRGEPSPKSEIRDVQVPGLGRERTVLLLSRSA
ncbi:MAG: 16S rRNA (guanine(527)-N(7))-methyltransferase RsmG [Spirochaetaceae bacterium]